MMSVLCVPSAGIGLCMSPPEAMKGDAVNRICTHCEQPCDFSAVRIEIATSDDEKRWGNGASSGAGAGIVLVPWNTASAWQYDGKGELAEYAHAAARGRPGRGGAAAVETPDALEAHLKSAFSAHTHVASRRKRQLRCHAFVSWIRGMHWWITAWACSKGILSVPFLERELSLATPMASCAYTSMTRLPQVEQPDRFFMAKYPSRGAVPQGGLPDQASAKGVVGRERRPVLIATARSGKTNVREWPMEAQFKTQ
ncbi:hypothetical protein FVE85_8885 [Porphyridium purpureum]|uniref:Uncharacterized protein n=1 Tax=Porphyridium purpureum TaxID=35688 RepID=A0A5J4YR80_PORPP|nr:hypothetical protein FVE85_8885 [Porphyridium purpureum]|eukprot:POR3671..scf296_7